MRFSARETSRIRMDGRSIATAWKMANMNRPKRCCGAWRVLAVWLAGQPRRALFVALCSQLVTSLLKLRRRAEAESAGGVRNSALLVAKHPGWRLPRERAAAIPSLVPSTIRRRSK
jgi:hypothetical protein